jgi:hypothetical protein
MTQLRMDGWMDGWIHELQLGLSQVSLGFYLYQVFFVFGNFLHPRKGKKRSQCYKGFFGGKNGLLSSHYEGFNFLNLPYLEVML